MPDDNKALLRRFYEELWTKGNLDAGDELVSRDYVDHQPAPGLRTDRDGFRALVRAWREGFPDGRETIGDLIAEGDKVVGRFTFEGTHTGVFFGIPPTGRRVRMHGIDIATIANGKIVELWYSEQTYELLQQLGVVPGWDELAGRRPRSAVTARSSGRNKRT